MGKKQSESALFSTSSSKTNIFNQNTTKWQALADGIKLLADGKSILNREEQLTLQLDYTSEVKKNLYHTTTKDDDQNADLESTRDVCQKTEGSTGESGNAVIEKW